MTSFMGIVYRKRNGFWGTVPGVTGPIPRNPFLVSWRIMPSWNIHTAHVERLFEQCRPGELGIGDPNAFLFGNYAPDIYLGFMVDDITFHVDYCLTHMAEPNVTPVPDADRFWDLYVCRRPMTPVKRSLALGAWAHLAADRMYNGRFRGFAEGLDAPGGDELRTCKQGDFDAFGRSLAITSHVKADDALFDAALAFRPYSILPEDVVRTIGKADEIVDASAPSAQEPGYSLIGAEWMQATFDACDTRLKSWLATWKRLSEAGRRATSADVRAEAGLPPANPMEADVA